MTQCATEAAIGRLTAQASENATQIEMRRSQQKRRQNQNQHAFRPQKSASVRTLRPRSISSPTRPPHEVPSMRPMAQKTDHIGPGLNLATSSTGGHHESVPRTQHMRVERKLPMMTKASRIDILKKMAHSVRAQPPKTSEKNTNHKSKRFDELMRSVAGRHLDNAAPEEREPNVSAQKMYDKVEKRSTVPRSLKEILQGSDSRWILNYEKTYHLWRLHCDRLLIVLLTTIALFMPHSIYSYVVFKPCFVLFVHHSNFCELFYLELNLKTLLSAWVKLLYSFSHVNLIHLYLY